MPDDAPGAADVPPASRGRDATEATTVGTGSALAIGCVVALVLIVLVALIVRWTGGAW